MKAVLDQPGLSKQIASLRKTLRFLVPDLIRNHHGFRHLWLSQLVSNFGDWFGVLAAFTLILRHNGSEFMLGAFIVTKMLSFAAFSPFGGYLADRFPRRYVMIATDIGRALVVLLFVFADSPGMLWILFAGTALQMFIAAIFEPARSGITPDLLKGEQLTQANVISSATWSIIFALGMGIGGLATEGFGVKAVFVFDAFTYLISAWFIRGIPEPGIQKAGTVSTNPWQGITEGLKYVRNHAAVRLPVLVKGVSSLFLGGLVYAIVLIGDQKLGMGAVGIGLLYMSRGVGTAFGPVLGKRFFPESKRWLSAFGLFMGTAGIFYIATGLTSTLWMLLLFVFAAHAASAASWVLSTVLVQERTEAAFRGRVSGLEWLGFTVGNSISTLAAATLLERAVLDIDSVMIVFGGLLFVCGAVWVWIHPEIRTSPWWKKTKAPENLPQHVSLPI